MAANGNVVNRRRVRPAVAAVVPAAAAAQTTITPADIARIEQTVTDKVMAELRPLLGELAKLTQKPAAIAGADTAAAEGSGGQMTAEEAEALSGAPEEITRMLQEEASRRMQELQMSLAQRVKSSEARFIRRMRKMKLS